jgi:AraC-like DNA-binding protein
MKTAEEQIAFLEAHASSKPSKWREKAELRRANSSWLPYSRKIAIKVVMAMKDHNLTRSDVATRMGCSPQYVSRLLKGEENLSLETICKLENAVDVSILQYAFV